MFIQNLMLTHKRQKKRPQIKKTANIKNLQIVDFSASVFPTFSKWVYFLCFLYSSFLFSKPDSLTIVGVEHISIQGGATIIQGEEKKESSTTPKKTTTSSNKKSLTNGKRPYFIEKSNSKAKSIKTSKQSVASIFINNNNSGEVSKNVTHKSSVVNSPNTYQFDKSLFSKSLFQVILLPNSRIKVSFNYYNYTFFHLSDYLKLKTNSPPSTVHSESFYFI